MKNRKDGRVVDLNGVTTKGEPMMFPHLRETFYLAGIKHDDIWPKHTVMVEDFEKLTINAIEGDEVKGEDV